MTSPDPFTTAFAAEQTLRRRLLILRLLAQATDYLLDEATLQAGLAAQGHPVARVDLRADLTHLDNQDCLIKRILSGVWAPQLTATGLDVAQGLARAEGVGRPRPGEGA